MDYMNIFKSNRESSCRESNQFIGSKCPVLDFESRSTRKKSAGFSFIEILAVVAIVSLLSAIIVPNFFGLRDRRLLTATKDKITEELKTAAGNSRVGQEDTAWGVTFTNSASDSYEIWKNPSGRTVVRKTNLTEPIIFVDPASGQSKNIRFSRGKGLPLNDAGTVATISICISNNISSWLITAHQSGRIDTLDKTSVNCS